MVRRTLLAATVVILFACGGRADGTLDDDAGPGDASPDQAEQAPDGGPVGDASGPDVTDATSDACPATTCPAGSTLGADCRCWDTHDAAVDACASCPPYTTADGNCSCRACGGCAPGWILEPNCGCFDPDSGLIGDGSPWDVYIPDSSCFAFCPPGYVQTPECSCVSTFPDDGGCVCTPYGCNCGFDASCAPCPSGTQLDSNDCQCIPLDASVDAHAGNDASVGPGCWLEGYQYCPGDTWCELGSCPNGTQTGCYCNANCKASCSVECPPPAPCYIPSFGDCPAGASCAVGPCPNPADGSVVCFCSQDGTFSCDSSCNGASDGGPETGPTPTDAGPGCYLSVGYGYPYGPYGGTEFCASGTFCELGVCPDGVTQYGCFCNADGTASCSLSCPPPPPCYVPGYGDCAVNTTCTVGMCPNNGGPINCTCYQGGSYTCSGSCDGADAGVFIDP